MSGMKEQIKMDDIIICPVTAVSGSWSDKRCLCIGGGKRGGGTNRSHLHYLEHGRELPSPVNTAPLLLPDSEQTRWISA